MTALNVLVAGAGVAGAAAAAFLADGGLSVDLVEAEPAVTAIGSGITVQGNALRVDCPGSGEALRLGGLTARIDTEAWAAACVDYLLARGDADPARISLAGWSLGGYFAPRAAAFEKRLASSSPGARTTTAALLGPRQVGLGPRRPRRVHRIRGRHPPGRRG